MMPPCGSDGWFKASEKNTAISTKTKTITTAQPSRSPTPDLDNLLGPETAEEDTLAPHSFTSLQRFPPSVFVSPHISTAQLTSSLLLAPPDSPQTPSLPLQPPTPPRKRMMAARVMNFTQAGDTFSGWPNQDPEVFI
jgi:hypothetical protein